MHDVATITAAEIESRKSERGADPCSDSDEDWNDEDIILYSLVCFDLVRIPDSINMSTQLPVQALMAAADKYPKPQGITFTYGTAGFRTKYVVIPRSPFPLLTLSSEATPSNPPSSASESSLSSVPRNSTAKPLAS